VSTAHLLFGGLFGKFCQALDRDKLPGPLLIHFIGVREWFEESAQERFAEWVPGPFRVTGAGTVCGMGSGTGSGVGGWGFGGGSGVGKGLGSGI